MSSRLWATLSERCSEAGKTMRFSRRLGITELEGSAIRRIQTTNAMEKLSARVKSVDEIQVFRVALLEFGHDAGDALGILLWEVRKVIEWIEHDRSQYWPAQVRKASDELVQARTDLERCELAIRPDDRSPCTEQKKALERAKSRLRYCEQKVETVRHWKRTLHHEINEFQGRLRKLANFLEADIPRAVAALDRILKALDHYTQAGALPGISAAGVPAANSSITGEVPPQSGP